MRVIFFMNLFLVSAAAFAETGEVQIEDREAVRGAVQRICGDWDSMPTNFQCQTLHFNGPSAEALSKIETIKTLVTAGSSAGTYKKQNCEEAVKKVWSAKEMLSDSITLNTQEEAQINGLQSRVSTTADNMRQIGADIRTEAGNLKARRTHHKTMLERYREGLQGAGEFSRNARINAEAVTREITALQGLWSQASRNCSIPSVPNKFNARTDKLKELEREDRQAHQGLSDEINRSNQRIQTLAGVETNGQRIEQSGQALGGGAAPQAATPQSPPAQGQQTPEQRLAATMSDPRANALDARQCLATACNREQITAYQTDINRRIEAFNNANPNSRIQPISVDGIMGTQTASAARLISQLGTSDRMGSLTPTSVSGFVPGSSVVTQNGAQYISFRKGRIDNSFATFWEQGSY